MKNLSVIQKCLLCILSLASICIISMAAFTAKESPIEQAEPTTSNNSLILSHESGFYAEPLDLKISGNNISEIYYTLDGSDPSRENPTAFLYSNGIFITNEETETVCTIRLLAYYEDGTTSGIVNRTFITGDNVQARYDVPVLSLSAPEEFFWSEEYGILYLDHKFIMTGREYEKEIFMTLFDETGNVLLSQNCGFRIHGNYSKVKNQPSFRLYARSEYDEQNDFEYALFDNQYSWENTLVPEYKRIIVRNSGNDNGYAFIRSELASRLSLDAGFPDAPCAAPVAVYLNNTYFGFYWLVTNYDETYYRETYGDYDGTMYTFSGAIHNLTLDWDEPDPTVVSLVTDYNEQMAFFSSCDLTEEQNWTALNNFMDVENFLKYIAIEHYFSNDDSLNNNYKIYRYVAPEGGSYRPGTVFDGKYRFLLYDLDHAFGYIQGNARWSSVKDLTTTTRMTTNEDRYLFFQNLLSREDCRDYYIRYTLSLQNCYFSLAHAGAVLEEMHASRENELRYTYTNSSLLINNGSAPDVTSDEDIQKALNKIYYFLEYRPSYVAEDLSGIFGPFTTYGLIIENPENANITLDYATLNDSYFTGMYYREVPVTVTAAAKPGYRFDYWLINGEKYEGTSFEITSDMISDKNLYLECVCSQDSEAEICITALKSNTGNDYIQLTNLGTQPRYLNNYHLTDDEQWNKSSLPAVTLAAGETITIYCNNYTELDTLGQPYVNFNLQAGETLSLYRSGQIPLQTVVVPSLGTEEGVYTMDMATGIFREVRME